MNPANKPSHSALFNARIALKHGDKRSARKWAEAAVAANPHQEEPWLMLAALASPRASIAYLTRALEINPGSQRARKGMHWAVQRFRTTPKPSSPARQVMPKNISRTALAGSRPALIPWLVVFLFVIGGGLIWFSTPTLSLAFVPRNSLAYVQSSIAKATLTLTPTATWTPTPTATLTPTPTDTPTPTITPTTEPSPTTNQKPAAEEQADSKIFLPPGVEPGEKWIDVDLTNQRVSAYKGKNFNEYLYNLYRYLAVPDRHGSI